MTRGAGVGMRAWPWLAYSTPLFFEVIADSLDYFLLGFRGFSGVVGVRSDDHPVDGRDGPEADLGRWVFQGG